MWTVRICSHFKITFVNLQQYAYLQPSGQQCLDAQTAKNQSNATWLLTITSNIHCSRAQPCRSVESSVEDSEITSSCDDFRMTSIAK